MAKIYLVLIFTALSLCVTSISWALPNEALVRDLNASVLRVRVNLPDGKLGLGSAVVIASDEVITNCHVVNDATDVSVIINGVAHTATGIKPDWHHDLCILKVENLDAPQVKFGASKTLRYETAIFTAGYPDETTQPVNTFGVVKGLFPMDGSMIIRATSAFKLGASGGGAFDETGNLIGIITLKSRGSEPYYYYMPVEWVQTLMDKPAQSLGAKSEKPFWALDAKSRPYFMQVVSPYIKHDWSALHEIASEWAEVEPDAAESWFYLAESEYYGKDFAGAETHFRKVLMLNHEHPLAIDYLARIAKEKVVDKPLEKVALLLDQ